MTLDLVPFDDRDGWIWFDGKIVPWRDAKIHVLNHGLHYASCVFEGERVYDGKIFKLTEHSERLGASAKLLGFDLPFTTAQIDEATKKVVELNEVANGYVRPFAWRGSKRMAISSRDNDVHVAVAAWPWPPYYSFDKNNGLKLTRAKWVRPDPRTAPTASKAAGLYMICTLSKHAAEDEGFQDAMMLDWRGFIAEACSANIFLVQDGKLHTPLPDCFLNGITRLTIIDLAKKAGIEVIERHIKPEELANTQEVFLTGTAAEIAPVSQIDEFNFQVGQVTEQLVEAYGKLVRA